MYSSFNLRARRGWVANAKPLTLYPRERPGIHGIEGWVGHRARLDVCIKSRFIPQGLDPRTVQPVANRHTD
jgi:hypothetical protein